MMDSMDDVVESMKKQWQQRERHFMDVVQTLRDSLVEERQRSSMRAGSEEQRDHALEQQAMLEKTVRQYRGELEVKEQMLEELQRRLDVAEAESVALGIELEGARFRPPTSDGIAQTEEPLFDEAESQTVDQRTFCEAAVTAVILASTAEGATQTEEVDPQPEGSGRVAAEDTQVVMSAVAIDEDLEAAASSPEQMRTLSEECEVVCADELPTACQQPEEGPSMEREEELRERCATLERALEKAVSMSEALSNWSEHLLKVGDERRTAVESLEKRLSQVTREKEDLEVCIKVFTQADALTAKERSASRRLARLKKSQVASIYMQCSYEELCENLNSRYSAEKSLTWDDKRVLYAITHELLPITMTTISSHVEGVCDSDLPAFLKMWNDDVVYPIVTFYRGSSSEALRSIAGALRAIIANPPSTESMRLKCGKTSAKSHKASRSSKKSSSQMPSVRFEVDEEEEQEGAEDEELSDGSHSTLEGDFTSQALSTTFSATAEEMELSTTSRAAIRDRRRSVQQSQLSSTFAPFPAPGGNGTSGGDSLLGLYTSVDEDEWLRDDDE